MTMLHNRKDLRPGDIVECTGRVDTDRSIWWDLNKLTVTKPALAVGDYVSWWDKGKSARRKGRIIGINKDGDDVWCWVKEDGCWPRLTFKVEELQRTALGGEPV